ncbi:MAG: type II toxin-antitoxin system death-on-curing family toxin [Actinomycetota bacterium]|nr:type II toxin-antitoxin system death-on-curing family toxin [Actinomycetota bacterium]
MTSGKDEAAETDFLTIEDLLEIANAVIPGFRIRDIGLLQSACARPQTTVFGEMAYPTLLEQAGALMHSLGRNHPLIDGNKRLAWAGLRVFLALNGRSISYGVDEAEHLVLKVARGEIEVADVAAWLGEHQDGQWPPIA